MPQTVVSLIQSIGTLTLTSPKSDFTRGDVFGVITISASVADYDIKTDQAGLFEICNQCGIFTQK